MVKELSNCISHGVLLYSRSSVTSISPIFTQEIKIPYPFSAISRTMCKRLLNERAKSCKRYSRASKGRKALRSRRGLILACSVALGGFSSSWCESPRRRPACTAGTPAGCCGRGCSWTTARRCRRGGACCSTA